MNRAYFRNERAVPIWAVIGAPLVGVPLMVALLALSSPKETAPVVEPKAGFTTEQVEIQRVEPAFDQRVDNMERFSRSC